MKTKNINKMKRTHLYNILYKKEYKYDNPLIHILIENPIR